MQKTTCSVPDCTTKAIARGWCSTHYGTWYRTGSPELPTKKPAMSAEERFWGKVKKTPTCWEWQGPLRSGYGVVSLNKTSRGAHRIAYEFAVGPIPDGLLIDHRCRNRACVNPEHLRLATNKQNMENLSGAQSHSTSGYRGVHWKSREQRWLATVVHNGVHHYGGYFVDRHEAAVVAREMRQALFTHSDADYAT